MIETLKSLHLTFYSSSFYQQLITRWKGIGFGFLLVVAFLSLLNIAVHLPFDQIKETTRNILSQMPEITMTNHELSMAATSPQEIKLAKEEKGEKSPLIVFDVKIDDHDFFALVKYMEENKIFVLVTKTFLIMRNPQHNKTETHNFNNIEDFTMTPDNWVELGEKIIAYSRPVMAFPLFGLLLFQHLATAFAGAILLLLISMLLKYKTELSNMMRLSCAAKVPVALLALIVTPHLALMGGVWLGFALFGLITTKKNVINQL